MRNRMKLMLIFYLFSIMGSAQAGNFRLTSEDIVAGERLALAQVANVFGCEGENLSPQLSWSNPPENTKSFAVTVYDPDAPTGSGFWHWMVINIPADIHELKRDAGNIDNNKLPQGARQLQSDYGFYGFGGACPPPGDERLFFALRVTKCLCLLRQILITRICCHSLQCSNGKPLHKMKPRLLKT